MICVLDITAGPERGRRVWIKAEERLEIGRLSTADMAITTDPHMSRRHLVLEGVAQAFRLRDVGSANGTFVNAARVSNVELCHGDRVRAGSTVFEVSLLADDDNPHRRDGITFTTAARGPAAGDSRELSSDTRRFSLLVAEADEDSRKAGDTELPGAAANAPAADASDERAVRQTGTHAAS